MKAKVLLIEDELSMATILVHILEKEHYETQLQVNGKEGLNAYYEFKPDICVIDVMLPDLDGYAIASAIRQQDKSIPLILLTAKTATADVLKGFNTGINDYIKKPFNVDELLARIQAHLMHAKDNGAAASFSSATQFSYDPIQQKIQVGDDVINLTGKENELMQYMTQHVNQLMLKTDIMKTVWGHDDFFNSRNLDVHISKLRKYLKGNSDIAILNIRGYGFKFVCDPRWLL